MRIKYWLKMVAITLGAAMLLVYGGAAQAKDTLVIATAGTGGTYYPMGGGLAMVLQKNIPQIKEATAQVTAGSVENCRLLGKDEVDIALVNAVVAREAAKGSKRFGKGIKTIKSLFWAHLTHQHFIVAKNSGIKSLYDLKGKTVSIGAPGSGAAFNCMALFKVAGIDPRQMKLQYLPSSTAINAFKDGRLDCLMVPGGIPVGSVTALAMSRDIALISLDKAILTKLNQKYPGFVITTIPAGTYKGVDKTVNTYAAACTLLASEKLSVDLAYDIIKVTKAKQKWLAENVHKGFSQYKFDPSIGRVVPLHPGAVKYYREQGLLK